MKPSQWFIITMCAFTLWELLAHTFLMYLPMPLWHIISADVSTLIALTIIVLAVRTIYAQERILEEASRLKDSLTQLLVYDLRAPLMATLSALEAVDANLEAQTPPETRQAVALAKDSNQSLLGMVNDLLEITRIEDKTLTLNRTAADVSVIVQEAVDDVTPIAAISGTAIAAEVAPDLPCISLDASRVRRLLVNLLNNAVQLSHSGGWVTLRARLLPDARRLELSVTDTGEGIPPEHRKDVFQKFYRVKTRHGDRTSAIGLSLFYCRLIAKAHGGTIRMESDTGRGSTVIVEIPAR